MAQTPPDTISDTHSSSVFKSRRTSTPQNVIKSNLFKASQVNDVDRHIRIVSSTGQTELFQNFIHCFKFNKRTILLIQATENFFRISALTHKDFLWQLHIRGPIFKDS